MHVLIFLCFYFIHCELRVYIVLDKCMLNMSLKIKSLLTLKLNHDDLMLNKLRCHGHF